MSYDQSMTRSRSTWRTLVRVVDAKGLVVVVPGWNPAIRVPLSPESLPAEVRAKLRPNARVHAHVNLAAQSVEELRFEKWELS